MRARTIILLIETIVGVQFWTTGLILLTLKELVGGLLCIFIGAFILLGLFKWVMNRKYGKGKWENKVV
jgi:hypothetical protein